MCVAVPGKVAAVDDKYADVEFGGSIVKARRGLVEVKPGDYVLVHAGYIIQTLAMDEAEEMTALMKLMEESSNEQRD